MFVKLSIMVFFQTAGHGIMMSTHFILTHSHVYHDTTYSNILWVCLNEYIASSIQHLVINGAPRLLSVAYVLWGHSGLVQCPHSWEVYLGFSLCSLTLWNVMFVAGDFAIRKICVLMIINLSSPLKISLINFSWKPFHSLQSQINAKFGHMYSSGNQRRLEMTAEVSENSELGLTFERTCPSVKQKLNLTQFWVQHMYFQSKAFVQVS